MGTYRDTRASHSACAHFAFEDGADIYWARQLVLERLLEAERELPPGVLPEHIVVDSAAHASKRDLAAMVEGSDKLVIVSEPEIMSLDVLPDILSDLDKLGSDNHKVLICQVSPRSDTAEARAVIESLSVKTFKRHIRGYAAYRLAALQGTTVDQVTNEYATEAWADYVAFARELL